MGNLHAGAAYIAALNERIEIQAEEIKQLREIISQPGSIPVEWGLTPTESRMLHAIARGNGHPVNRERIAAFVYGSQGHSRNPKIFDVMLHHIRKKRASHGLNILTAQSFGPYMSREDCATVRQYFEAA